MLTCFTSVWNCRLIRMWQGRVVERIIYRFTTEDISSRGWTANTIIWLSCLIDNLPNLNGASSCGCGSLEGSEIQLQIGSRIHFQIYKMLCIQVWCKPTQLCGTRSDVMTQLRGRLTYSLWLAYVMQLQVLPAKVNRECHLLTGFACSYSLQVWENNTASAYKSCCIKLKSTLCLQQEK